MDDVWFAAGLTRGDLDRCLEALSLQSGRRSPLIAVATRGEDGPRLVLASRALFKLFGVDGGEALSDRLLAGRDPGARRLATLQSTLPLEGAPRLERLRFFLGPSSEIITFLCRRVRAEAGRALFVAAALNVRESLLPNVEASTSIAVAPTLPTPGPAYEPIIGGPVAAQLSPSAAATPAEAPSGEPLPSGPLDVQAIHAALRRRWPSRRNLRFLWQSDAGDLCIQVTPPLAEIVGAGNADLVGVDLVALAPHLDPSGRFEAALLSRESWSGVDVAWPIDDASAAVSVGLGAIPVFDPDRSFSGYRGYGIVKLDEVVTREPLRIGVGQTGQVIAFPSKALSADDERAFAALAAELRDKAGLADQSLDTMPAATQPSDATPPITATAASVESAELAPDPALAPLWSPEQAEPPATEPVSPSIDAEPFIGSSHSSGREVEIARNGLALLDRIAVGLLVSRDNIPIFANRHFLELTGFLDEDALHAAGGMAHIFGSTPGDAGGAEVVAVRGSDGTSLNATARVQRIEWDGLPATLLTLQQDARAPLEAAKPRPAPSPEDDERRELRAILETATDGVVVMDHACNVLSLNRAGEALFGRDRGEVIGQPFLDLFAAHDRDLARDYLEGVKSNATRSLLNDGREFLVAAARGTANRSALPGTTTPTDGPAVRDGRIPVFMTLGRLGPSDEAAVPSRRERYCALFRDLTHWKKVEGELEEARRAAERASAHKTDFLAKVSHEVRTPLNAIIGFAEVLMEERFGPLGNERYKDYLRDIHGSGTHVMSLVNDLLDLTKIEAGKMELAPQSIDVNRIVSECVAAMQPQASRERVILRLALAPALPKVTADERSLRQIALNLLSNAVKFNEPGGQVIVASQLTESGSVVLRIRDTGPGMSESDIAAALEPFRRLSRQPASGVAGTGLGLPLTKALVEANEAALTIRSKVDQGTFVEVSFPPARVLAAG